MEFLFGFAAGAITVIVAIDWRSRVRAARIRHSMVEQHVRDLDDDFRDWARGRKETERLAGRRIA